MREIFDTKLYNYISGLINNGDSWDNIKQGVEKEFGEVVEKEKLKEFYEQGVNESDSKGAYSTDFYNFIAVERTTNGKTWSELADAVNKKFGMSLSSGNLYNIYNRYVIKEAKQKAFTDKVLQYYVRTHNKTLTAELCVTSLYSVNKQLQANADSVQKLEAKIKQEVKELLAKSYNVDDIANKLSYNGVPLGNSIIGRIYAELQAEKLIARR